MNIVLAQIDIRLNRTNLKRHVEIIKQNSFADVVVFPELSLNGYMLQDRVYEDSYTIRELAVLNELSKDVDIIVGAAIKSDNRIFNSALYFSDKELIHRHDKIHLPNYGMFEEARFYDRGYKIESFKTKYGSAVMVICEDLWKADTISELAKLDFKILYVLSNSPAREFNDEGIKIADQWYSILKTVAILNGCYAVFINRVGFEDGLGFWGGSIIVNPNGDILNSFELFDEQIKGETI